MVSILTTLNDWAKVGIEVHLLSTSARMREKFDKYFGSMEKCNMIVLVVVVLDPKYKLDFVKFYCKKVHGDGSEMINVVTENLKLLSKHLFEYFEHVCVNDNQKN